MTSPITFIQETREELKQVVWPKRTETIRLTGIVIIISITVALYISGIDAGMAKLMQTFVYK
ncbi:hypothetical protein BH11PAT1_BH11PAT1_2000 [soil metagenome]